MRVAKLKRAFDPDLVHVNSYGRSILFYMNTATTSPAPLLLTLHQALPNQPVGTDTLLGHALHSAQWITACSKTVLDHARQLVPNITPRSSLIHNALEIPHLHPDPISFNPPRLLCLGRLVANKGFDLALAAFGRVMEHFPGIRLVIAGDGPERKRLAQQIVELGISDRVELTGLVTPDAVPALLNAVTLVVIPSRTEGFGLVALEAALMARPVVATCVGGLPEVVENQTTGLLVKKESPKALANAIEHLLSHPDAAASMGSAARSRAMNRFNWDQLVDGYDGLYRRLITGTKPRMKHQTRPLQRTL